MIKNTKEIFVVLGISLVYFISARLSLYLAFEATNASPIWPPSGIAFAAVLIFGRKALFAVFIGAVAANLLAFQGNHTFSASILLCSLMIGLGNTLEAFLAHKFYRSFQRDENPLSSYQSYFQMLMVTFAACLSGAVTGTVSLLITNIISFDLFRTVLATWWLGDYVGVVIVTPIILSIYNLKNYKESKDSTLEFIIHLIILVAVSSVIFSNSGTVLSEMSFIILPFLLWMVYRFSVPYVSIAVTIVSFISVFGTVNGYGPFVRGELNESLLLLQVFMGITAVTFTALAITLNKESKKEDIKIVDDYTRSSVWFSSISFIICLTASLFVIHNKEKENDELVDSRVSQQAYEFNHTMNTEIEFITEALERMGKRSGLNSDMLKSEWMSDANSYFKDFEIFKAIQLVDSHYRVKWVYPEKGNEQAIGLNLKFEPIRKMALETSKNEVRTVISQPVDLLQGGRGVIVSVPVYNEEGFQGFILGVTELNTLFSSFLNEIEDDYFVQILIGDTTAYLSKDFSANYFSAVTKGSFNDFSWELTLVPKPAFLSQLGKLSNIFSIVLAFLISVLFSLTVYLIFNARCRAKSLFELNETLIRKNEELNKEKEISQQAAVAKSEFLANMSHEIRTPMNGVLGALQLAMDSRDDEVKNYLKVIDISAKNLMDIINDILDYSKIEAGKLNLEIIPFNLKKIVQESLIVVENKAKSQNVELSASFDFENENNFKGDPVRIRQVLLNLLSNAVKFTCNGSVKVKAYTNEAKQVCIEVVDSGIGIPEEKLEHIFEQFSQADTSTTREYGGTGLGLAITSQLVQLMDGEVSVESKEGEGTTFKVVLPLEQTEIKLIETKEDLERKYGKRVLLCEDNKTNQDVIKQILERLGIDVEIVGNGKEALEVINSDNEEFDLIFMDIHMPEMDGYKSTEELLKIIPDTPIIALTANTTAKDKQKCYDVGMQGYLTKPIQKNLLIDELDKWFGKAS